MATVFVDLVNLDGSRPEGRLKFSLEQLRIGDPDVVPSSVEVAILDGKARVEDLLPGEMKVQVSTGRWSKEWQVAIPDNGTHDLFDLLGTSAPEFEHALWATLLGRVEALENTPAVDLAPVEKRLDALEGAPKVDLAPLEKRVKELEAKPEPAPVDLTPLEKRITALENAPKPDLAKYVPRAEYDALAHRVTALENSTRPNFGENQITPPVSMTVGLRTHMAVKEWSALYAISQAAPPNVDKLAFINKTLSTSLGESTGATSIDSLKVVDPSGTKLAEVYASYIKEKPSDFMEFEKLLNRFTQAVSNGEVVL